MAKKITGDRKKLDRILNLYIKHKGLEIEITMKDGQTYLLDREREMSKDTISFTPLHGQPKSIAVREIKKAEVFAV